MATLKCLTLNIQALSSEQKQRMFQIFARYYHNAHYDTFQKDLHNKDVVFLLIDKTQKIQGFSTLKNIEVEWEGRFYRCAFSGDTIIEKEFWGSGALGVGFLKYLLIQKLKKPHKKLYWYLISKGFKTYLLMANNFPVHYPRYEQETPSKESALIDAIGLQLYGENYDKQKGLISFQDKLSKDALKEDVAPITLDLLENPRIAFFVKKNPSWFQGDELACLAEMTLMMPVRYQLKILQKKLKSFLGRTKKLLGQELSR